MVGVPGGIGGIAGKAGDLASKAGKGAKDLGSGNIGKDKLKDAADKASKAKDVKDQNPNAHEGDSAKAKSGGSEFSKEAKASEADQRKYTQKAAQSMTKGGVNGVGGKGAMFKTLLAGAKHGGFGAAAAGKSIGATIAHGIKSAAKGVAHFFVSVGQAVSSAVGGVVSAATATVATASIATTALVVGGVTAIAATSDGINKSDGPLPDCTEAVSSSISSAKKDDVNTSAKTEELAKKIYSVFSAWGMKDENIAGILGNWTVESGIDTTGVETIYDEPHQMGPRKTAAEKAGFKVEAVDAAYGANHPLIKLVGIGLGQWTNGRNTMLLDYAKSINKPWYELETQLGFMISKDDQVRVKQIKDMISGKEGGSVEKATEYFLTHWEGINNGTLGQRTEAAGSWFAKMSGWNADKTLADSILAQSKTSLDKADANSVSNSVSQCQTNLAGSVSNGDLAKAAVSYAWPTQEEGKFNDGTDIYRYLHKQIFPDGVHFASCDNSVATAVRWSGTDDDYPPQAVKTQIEYVQSHPDKWKKIDFDGDVKKLQPGDIFLRNDNGVSHTVMFVGEEAVKEVFKDRALKGGNIVSGSLNDRSPGVGTYYGGCASCLDTYAVYRNVKRTENSKYKDLKIPSNMRLGEGDKSIHTTPKF